MANPLFLYHLHHQKIIQPSQQCIRINSLRIAAAEGTSHAFSSAGAIASAVVTAPSASLDLNRLKKVAVIAHLDHGKTTLMDRLLRIAAAEGTSHAFSSAGAIASAVVTAPSASLDLNRLKKVAVIAHVDHGKTTLMDRLLRQCRTDIPHERAMNSISLERERGITISSEVSFLIREGFVYCSVECSSMR